jgi:hypothetical protein
VRKETEESSEDKELGREGRKIRNWMRKPEWMRVFTPK